MSPSRLTPPPETKQRLAPRTGAAVVLILLGALLISSGLLFVGSAPVPHSGGTQVTGESLSSPLILPENMTVGIMSWNACPGAAPVSAAWSASGPVNIYVVNTKQYAALLLPGMNIVSPPSLQNFSGMPVSWVSRYYLQNGNVSLSLSQGGFYFLAWSSTPAVLNSFVLAQTHHQVSGSCPPSFSVSLPALVLIALGAIVLVLGVSILKRRVWR